jgi:hypothetical protein
LSKNTGFSPFACFRIGSKILRNPQEEVSFMAEVKMPHAGHEDHLCLLQNVGYLKSNFEDYKKLVKDGKYVCKNCGRVAVNEKNLCAPEKL